jgi:hypothetical protein
MLIFLLSWNYKRHVIRCITCKATCKLQSKYKIRESRTNSKDLNIMVSRMMSYILVSIITAFTLLSPSDSTSSINCYGTHYKTINDPRRSTGYDVSSSNNTRNHLCDRHLLQDNAWYRFSSEAGGELPTTRPKLGSCGTYIPIWMNGSHPAIEDGIVARKACANVFPFGCGYSYNIHVRNCSGYYIYQLKTPANCVLAYCAGKLSCIYRVYYNSENYMHLSFVPPLWGGGGGQTPRHLQFFCIKFPTLGREKQVKYYRVWLAFCYDRSTYVLMGYDISDTMLLHSTVHTKFEYKFNIIY